MTPFRLAVCADTFFRELPFLDRVREIARAGWSGAASRWPWETTPNKGGRVVGTAKEVPSSDGKIWTRTATTINANGQLSKVVQVLDKQYRSSQLHG